jgi:hypothetical protein
MARKNKYGFQTKQRGVPVIERLKETGGVAFGFKVVGKLLDEELKTFEPPPRA